MNGHVENTYCFKLKGMQEAQHKTKLKAQQKQSTGTSNEAFAVEPDMSNMLDALNEMPEIQEFLQNMETEVCKHYAILNKSETLNNTMISYNLF